MRKYCYLEANTDLGREEFEFTLKPMPMESVDEYEVWDSP